MSLLTLPDAPIATASQRPTAVRVRGSDGSRRIVPLAVGKTTIGSSLQCVVCLPPGEARPLQCLVTATAEQAEATRWGAGALLNGREFARSPVRVGDRLSIGRCQIEFLAEAATAAPAAEEAPAAPALTVEWSAESPLVVPVESDVEQAAPIENIENGTEQTAASLPLVDELVAPIPDVATPSLDAPAITPHTAVSSQAFADRLIVDLWQAAHVARRRASALVRGVRDARVLADAMAADLSAMELELDLARAAYDSHARDHEQLHLELIERDRLATERMAPLQAEIDSLRSQLQKSQTELSEQAAHCEELDAALAIASQTVPSTEPPTNVDDERVDELERSLAVQIDQATWLARELGALRTEIERIRNESERQATRNRELEAELETARAAAAALKRTKLDLEDRDQTIVSLKSELASRDAQVSDLSSQLAVAEEKQLQSADVWASRPGEEASSEIPSQPLSIDSLDSLPAEPTAWPAVSTESAPDWTASHPGEPNGSEVQEPAKAPKPEPSPLFAAVETSPAPVIAPEPTPSSFIDKYRHLLDDDGEPASSEQPSRTRIDEEFLSPAKAAQHVSPADDGDDALEAYMAGMMQRVRGASDAPAHLAPLVESPRPAATLASSVPSSSAAVSPADEAIDDEPFDIESMKQGRRPGASTDLSTMREIANSSARSAIATHRKRRTVESTVGKAVVAVIALATAGCLMWKAPSVRDWEFIVGAGFGVIGFAMAAVIGRNAGRAASEVRAATLMNGPAGADAEHSPADAGPS